MSTATEAAILSRVIKPNDPILPASVAKVILKWEFSPDDRIRMTDLVEKAKRGSLTQADQALAETYERVGHMISILKSKARRSLKAKSIK